MATSIETLAPGILIAAPMLKDPNFDRTVVLMCIHNEEGAMGLVINRQAPLTIRDILGQLGMKCKTDCSQQAMVGGPVALDSGLLLYEADPEAALRDDELSVTETLRLCPNRELLIAIADGQGPMRYHMFLGHAGWGSGQLEQEISQGAWVPTPMRLDLIFSTPVEDRWEEALRCEGLSPAQFHLSRPQA